MEKGEVKSDSFPPSRWQAVWIFHFSSRFGKMFFHFFGHFSHIFLIFAHENKIAINS